MSATSTVTRVANPDSLDALRGLSRRELLTELALIEERIRAQLPMYESGTGDGECEPELLALFLRERAVTRHLNAERAMTTTSPHPQS